MIYSHWIFSFLILLNAFNAFPSKIVNDHVQNPVESKSFEEFLSVLTDQLDGFVNETDAFFEIYNNLTNQSSGYLASHHYSSDSLSLSEKVTSLDKKGFNSIDSRIRNHLLRVYRHLTLMSATALAGAITFYLSAGVILTIPIAMVLSLISLFGYLFSTHKMFFSLSMSFFDGIFLGAFVAASSLISTTAAPIALAGTVLIFLVFTMAAVFAPSEAFLKYGGTLFSILIGAILASIVNLFFASARITAVLSPIFLVIFSIFVGFDTQKMIQRAKLGYTDYINDAVNLYYDLSNIFVELLKILIENEESRD